MIKSEGRGADSKMHLMLQSRAVYWFMTVVECRYGLSLLESADPEGLCLEGRYAIKLLGNQAIIITAAAWAGELFFIVFDVVDERHFR